MSLKIRDFWTLGLATWALVSVCHSARTDSTGDILRELENPATSPERTRQLLKKLGPHDSFANGLDVAGLLEASELDEQKCTPDPLLERHSKRTMLLYDSGHFQAVVGLLDAQWSKQIDLCLKYFTKQLDKLFLDKMKQKVRDNLEIYDKLFSSFKADRKHLGPLDELDLADIAYGKYVGERRSEKDGKLSEHGKLGAKMGKIVRKTRKEIRRSLKESCQLAVLVLRPISELVKFAQADSSKSSAHEIAERLQRWGRIYTHCDQFNKRLTADDPDQVDDFDEISDS